MNTFFKKNTTTFDENLTLITPSTKNYYTTGKET